MLSQSETSDAYRYTLYKLNQKQQSLSHLDDFSDTDFICQQLPSHKLSSFFHLPCDCIAHGLSKAHKRSLKVQLYLSTRDPWLHSTTERWPPLFCLLRLFHFSVDGNAVSKDVLTHLILEQASMRGKAQPMSGEGGDRGGKRREGRQWGLATARQAERFWCPKCITRSWKSIFSLAQSERYANTSCFLRVFNTNCSLVTWKEFWCFPLMPQNKFKQISIVVST